MERSNFSFLKEKQSTLAQLAEQAEQYIYSDPQSSVVKLRCYSELVVAYIYTELNLSTYGLSNFFEKLKNDAFINAVEGCVIEKLHAIRIKGNKAAHADGVSIDDALWMVKEAYFIGAWLHIAIDKGNVEDLPQYQNPKPVTPEQESLLHDNNRLQEILNLQTENLRNAKEELLAAQLSQEQIQAQVAELTQEVDSIKLTATKIASDKVIASIDFEEAETRRRISIEDIFAEYSLTSGQKELVSNLGEFLSTKKQNVFLLKGYAGTGKTFITKGLTEYFNSIGRNYILAAPTGKASKVIASKTKSEAYTIHKTIYSFKDLVEYKDGNTDGTQTYKFYSELATNEDSVDTVYIIDEASMIADVYQEAEFFRFGSGYLLKDLLKYINIDHNDHNKKIIFIGDDAQLPPVGMKISPALSAKYLLKEHGIKSTSFELTEVVRQAEESGILNNSIKIRQSIASNIFNQINISLDFPDIQHVEHADLMQQYIDSCGDEINGESILIAHSNTSVADYNRAVRKHFFPGQSEVAPGDKVMATTNCNLNGFFICNGDFGLIRQVSPESEVRKITIKTKCKDTGDVEENEIPLYFRAVEVGFKDLHDNAHFVDCIIIENLLYSDRALITSDENKALYIDFCIRHPGLKAGTKEFKDTIKADKYFNALKVKFGYAITCHKAQGSEWNNVFVNCKWSQSQLSADYFRWLYTAITRSSKKLYTLEEPHIKPGGIMKSMTGNDFKRPNTSEVSSVENEFQQLDAKQNESKIELYNIPDGNDFLKSLLYEVRNRIDGHGIEIIDIAHNSYQEAYVFSDGSASTRLSFAYNNKNKVSAISTPSDDEFSLRLKVLLEPIKGMSLYLNHSNELPVANSFIFEEPFMKELYESILESIKSTGITIADIKPFQWHQRYTFTRGKEVAVFDLYFNGKKQFKKFGPFKNDCTSPDLVNEIGLILDSGL